MSTRRFPDLATPAVYDRGMDDETPPDVICPGCQGLDWARDGFAVSADGPRIEARRYAPPSSGDDPWRCRTCDYALNDGDPLATALSGVREAHWE